MKLWLDAQLSPEIADWITEHFAVEAIAVRDIGLRDASDVQIFTSAKQAGVVVVTKDSDFSQLLQRFGTPPHVIWLRCGGADLVCFELAALPVPCDSSGPAERFGYLIRTNIILVQRVIAF